MSPVLFQSLMGWSEPGRRGEDVPRAGGAVVPAQSVSGEPRGIVCREGTSSSFLTDGLQGSGPETAAPAT